MAELVNMKIEEKDRSTVSEAPVNTTVKDEYPWGLVLRLESGSIDKLGIDLKTIRVSDEVSLMAKCKVISLTESETANGNGNIKNQNMELQITDMSIEPEEFDDNLGWNENDMTVDEKLRRRGY